jgi:hypothetical protein
MNDTLERLKSGKLIGSKSLKLACGLKEFPIEILALSETLEFLDLSDNQMTVLPASFSKLKKLKIVFFARNSFTIFPTVLRECTALTMIGFKSNQIDVVEEKAFPPMLRWLILTDNKILSLPKSIGDCDRLQKCGLAGNLIQELPFEMSKCQNLELLRLSANRLVSIPEWLFELPKLSWVAFGGNPATHISTLPTDLGSFPWSSFEVKELLGEGASGLIYKASSEAEEEDIALKVFRGDVTSDGLPEDEMEVSIAAGSHEGLIPVLGKIKDHPEGKSGLLMKLISPDYLNLGNPPSLETCTRDVFDRKTLYSFDSLLKIAKNIASVSEQLHRRGINHGDLYAHNILINDKADCLLGDFGAASFYDAKSAAADNIERVEVRAFGCLLGDLYGVIDEQDIDDLQRDNLLSLINSCTTSEVKSRLSFSDILEKLNKF